MKVTELVFESEELEDCIKGFFNEVILLEGSLTYPISHSVVYHSFVGYQYCGVNSEKTVVGLIQLRK